MSDGPSDEDVRRTQRAAQEAKETASAFAPYVEANRLNPLLLKRVLDKHAPGNDAEDDGIYDTRWMAADAFYRFTDEYVTLENRLAYKYELDRAFPKRDVS